MLWKNIIGIVLICSQIIILNCCAGVTSPGPTQVVKAYPGPNQLEDDLATIHFPDPVMGDKIDDESLFIRYSSEDLLEAGSLNKYRGKTGIIARVEPGVHSVRVYYFDRNHHTGNVVLSSLFKAGKTYSVRYKIISEQNIDEEDYSSSNKKESIPNDKKSSYITNSQKKVYFWIEEGGSLEIPESYPTDSFYKAASRGDLQAINGFLHGEVRIKPAEFEEALIITSLLGDSDIVEILLNDYQQGKAEIRSAALEEALMKASGGGHSDIVEMLLDNGVNVDAVDKSGWNPISHAFRYCKEECIRTLKKYNSGKVSDIGDPDGNTVLMYVAGHCSTDLLSQVLRDGVNVNSKNNMGWTPLLHAMRSGKQSNIELLERHNAKMDVNVLDKNGWSPIHHASKNNNQIFCKELIQKNADLNLLTHDGYTAINLAIRYGNNELAEMLIKAGCRLDIKEKNTEFTPLLWAAKLDQTSMVNILLNAGADVNSIGNSYAADSSGSTGNILKMRRPVTSVFYAYANQNVVMLQALIHSGAKFELNDPYFIKKMQFGASSNSKYNPIAPEVRKILKENGF